MSVTNLERALWALGILLAAATLALAAMVARIAGLALRMINGRGR